MWLLGVLQKSFPKKIHKEIPVLQSLKELQAVRLSTLLKTHSRSGVSTSPLAAPERFRFPAYNFIIKKTTTKMFFCEFCKVFKDIFSFDRTPQDDCFSCLSVNFEFFRTLLLQSTSGELLFRVPVEEFQPPDTVRNYFTGPFKLFIQER